jgi:AcrR family transcriptional regulator
MARTTGSYSELTAPKIESAARRLIANYGFAAVSMRQIAKEVGLQAGALYNYVPDKQSLLARLMRTHMQDLLGATKNLPTGEPQERLDGFVRFHIAQNFERAESVFIAYMELRNLTPENFAEVEALRQQYERRLEEILQAGRANGVFDVTDIKIMTRAIIAMLNGVNTWFREHGALSLTQVQELNCEMVRRMVLRGRKNSP